MKPSEAIKTELIAKGWKYKGECHCSGMHTHKYELYTEAGFFKIRVRGAHFLISTPATRFTKFPISEIKQMIDDIHKNNQATI